MRSTTTLVAIAIITWAIVASSIFLTLWYSGLIEQYLKTTLIDIEHVAVYQNKYMVVTVWNKGSSNISIDLFIVDDRLVFSEKYLLEYKGYAYQDNTTQPSRIFISTGSRAIVAFQIPDSLYRRLAPNTMHEIGVHLTNGYIFEKPFIVYYSGFLRHPMIVPQEFVRIYDYMGYNDYSLTNMIYETSRVYILASGMVFNGEDYDALVISYDLFGNEIWVKRVDFGRDEKVTSISIINDLVYVVVVSTSNYTIDTYIVVLNDIGRKITDRLIASDVFITSSIEYNGYLYMVGYRMLDNGGYSGYIAVVDPNTLVTVNHKSIFIDGTNTTIHDICFYGDKIAIVGVTNFTREYSGDAFLAILYSDLNIDSYVVYGYSGVYEEFNGVYMDGECVVAVGSTRTPQSIKPIAIKLFSNGTYNVVEYNVDGVFYDVIMYNGRYIVASEYYGKPRLIVLSNRIDLVKTVKPSIQDVDGGFYSIYLRDKYLVLNGYVLKKGYDYITWFINLNKRVIA